MMSLWYNVVEGKKMIDKKRVRRYCYEPERIENYEQAIEDNNETWDCHHRLETIMNCGLKELKAQGCYYHRPAHDLIFLRHEDHIRLHKTGENNTQFGKHHSEERKKKVSEALKGRPKSEETRRKLSEAMKGKRISEETKMKMSEAHKGRTPWNKGLRKTTITLPTA